MNDHIQTIRLTLTLDFSQDTRYVCHVNYRFISSQIVKQAVFHPPKVSHDCSITSSDFKWIASIVYTEYPLNE